ncbi:unnamed protein product [Schistocephalus solidus]|uniref:Cystatin domain-containing protein n=1 Tax=Schistocephalus solidus TaxID=70667 RepID=A0A183TIH5_SCHSO|nr:unnamed protein product [Schistocephalus solidus]
MQSLLILLAVFALAKGGLACAAKDKTTDEPEPEHEPVSDSRPTGRPMLGGRRPMTTEEIAHPDFQSVVQKSLVDLKNQSNGCMEYDLVEIKEASKQVVSGLKYHWKMTVRPRSTQAGSQCPVSDCQVGVDACKMHHEYKSSAWVRPWLKDEETHRFTHVRTDA